jgi:hypothetical protein
VTRVQGHRLTLRERQKRGQAFRLKPIWSGGETIVANLHRSVSKCGCSVKKLLLSFVECGNVSATRLGRLGGTAGGQEPDEQLTFVGLDTTQRGLGAG